MKFLLESEEMTCALVEVAESSRNVMERTCEENTPVFYYTLLNNKP